MNDGVDTTARCLHSPQTNPRESDEIDKKNVDGDVVHLSISLYLQVVRLNLWMRHGARGVHRQLIE